MLGVFLQQFFEDAPGLGAEMVEEIFPVMLQSFGPLAAGSQGGIEGKMAEQVKGIGFRLTD